MAEDALAHHQAYLSVGGSVAGSADGHGVLGLACDLTKAIAALLTVTDSLAVCWLNGPALNASKSFVSTAREMFDTGVYPLALWIGVRWDAQAGSLQTNGMAQFDAPEICLAQQAEPSPRMVDYLFLVGQLFLTAHHSIPEGKTIDSPHGKLKVENSSAAGKRILTLKPVR
jgi:hypothetical protein